jgi:hypothetical protein
MCLDPQDNEQMIHSQPKKWLDGRRDSEQTIIGPAKGGLWWSVGAAHLG